MRRRSVITVTAIWIILGAAALSTLAAVLAGLMASPEPDSMAMQYFNRAFLDRAAEYQRISLSVFLIRQAALLLFLAAAAVFALRFWRARPPASFLAAVGYIILILLLYQLINFPFSYYRSFVIEHRFGFSTYTLGGWALDYLKSAAISLLISTAGLSGLYFLVSRRPERWWFVAGTVFALFLFISTYLYPLLIDPLFYRFTPLEDEALNSDIMRLAGRAGINVDAVLVADASRRTNKVNAYFTGLGGTKRIVIYDTLLERFPREEVLAVIAHEMGHWQNRHILKGVIMGAAGAFAALFVLHMLALRTGLSGDFRLIPLGLLFFAFLSLASSPVENAVSRAFEREADQAVLQLTGNPAAFISLKQRIAVANLATVRPHPLIKYALYTHPPIMERIEKALSQS